MTDTTPAPRPPARLIMTTPVHCLAFGFGTGLSPLAPGTVGSLLGIPLLGLFWLLPLDFYLPLLLILFGWGCWLCGESARLLGVHDAPGIVFDEVVGMLVAGYPVLLAVAEGSLAMPAWLALLTVFASFRLFDIVKPFPIRWLDRHVPGGIGIMVDDLLAAVYAAVLTWGVLQLWPAAG